MISASTSPGWRWVRDERIRVARGRVTAIATPTATPLHTRRTRRTNRKKVRKEKQHLIINLGFESEDIG